MTDLETAETAALAAYCYTLWYHFMVQFTEKIILTKTLIVPVNRYRRLRFALRLDSSYYTSIFKGIRPICKNNIGV